MGGLQPETTGPGVVTVLRIHSCLLQFSCRGGRAGELGRRGSFGSIFEGSAYSICWQIKVSKRGVKATNVCDMGNNGVSIYTMTAEGLGRKIRRSVLDAKFEMPLRDASGIIQDTVFLGLDI